MWAPPSRMTRHCEFPMRLFDDLGKTVPGPSSRGESLFQYYNRSNRVEIARVRALFEDWFRRYPARNKGSLRDRLRRSDESAFFELLLHEVLIRLGCHAQIHPRLRHVETKPDFLAETSASERFYLEGVVKGENAEDRRRGQLRDWLYDQIDACLRSQVSITLHRVGPNRLPVRKLISQLEAHLNRLDADEVRRPHNAGRVDERCWRWDSSGWLIDFFPMPKPARSSSCRDMRPIVSDWQFFYAGDVQPIRNALHDKATRYGRIRLPYVIALNVPTQTHDFPQNVITALFGEECASVAGMPSPLPRGAVNAFWGSRQVPKNTRVSAVLAVKWTNTANVSGARAYLCHNPWAATPYTSVLTRLPQLIREGDEMKWVDGESLGSILGLPPDWPKSE
jgi:hypothetical protein